MTATKRTRQKVDATIDLIIDDNVIKRDWKTLLSLQHTVRSKLTKPSRLPTEFSRPSLYKHYRGEGFPLHEQDGGRLRTWRKLTPWMKAQIASLCLQASHNRVITITLHEQLADELRMKESEPKAYLRDRLARCLRDEFGRVPWFQFVVEDRSASGKSVVKVHAHGVIQILPVDPRRLKDGSFPLRTKLKIRAQGLEAVRLEAGKDATFRAVKLASGNGGDRPKEHMGRDQARNVWWRRAYHPLFNTEWTSYSFKNAKKDSRTLPENRLVMSRNLNQEARRLWALIRDGEEAIKAWPSD